MPNRASTTALDLAELLASWELHLRAERKSAQTVKSYGDGVRAYLTWCATNDRPAAIDRRHLREFIDGLLTSGAKPATAVSRHLAVRRFSAWLADEGEQDADPLLGLKSPQLDKPVVEPLTDDQLRAMLKACRGPGAARQARRGDPAADVHQRRPGGRGGRHGRPAT